MGLLLGAVPLLVSLVIGMSARLRYAYPLAIALVVALTFYSAEVGGLRFGQLGFNLHGSTYLLGFPEFPLNMAINLFWVWIGITTGASYRFHRGKCCADGKIPAGSCPE